MRVGALRVEQSSAFRNSLTASSSQPRSASSMPRALCWSDWRSGPSCRRSRAGVYSERVRGARGHPPTLDHSPATIFQAPSTRASRMRWRSWSRRGTIPWGVWIRYQPSDQSSATRRCVDDDVADLDLDAQRLEPAEVGRERLLQPREVQVVGGVGGAGVVEVFGRDEREEGRCVLRCSASE